MGTSTLPTPASRRHVSTKQKDSVSAGSRTWQTTEASGTVTHVSLAEAVRAYEKDLIQDALRTTRGNRVQAAKLLDSTERIISYKVKKYNIDCRRFR